jgi:hypothetical protein
MPQVTRKTVCEFGQVVSMAARSCRSAPQGDHSAMGRNAADPRPQVAMLNAYGNPSGSDGIKGARAALLCPVSLPTNSIDQIEEQTTMTNERGDVSTIEDELHELRAARLSKPTTAISLRGCA